MTPVHFNSIEGPKAQTDPVGLPVLSNFDICFLEAVACLVDRHSWHFSPQRQLTLTTPVQYFTETQRTGSLLLDCSWGVGARLEREQILCSTFRVTERTDLSLERGLDGPP